MPERLATFSQVYELVRDQGELLEKADKLEVSERLGFGWQRIVERKRLRIPAGESPDGKEHIFSVAFSNGPQGEPVAIGAMLSATVASPQGPGWRLDSKVFRATPKGELAGALRMRIDPESGETRLDDYPLEEARASYEDELDFHLRVLFETGLLYVAPWYTPRYWLLWFRGLFR